MIASGIRETELEFPHPLEVQRLPFTPLIRLSQIVSPLVLAALFQSSSSDYALALQRRDLNTANLETCSQVIGSPNVFQIENSKIPEQTTIISSREYIMSLAQSGFAQEAQTLARNYKFSLADQEHIRAIGLDAVADQMNQSAEINGFGAEGYARFQNDQASCVRQNAFISRLKSWFFGLSGQ